MRTMNLLTASALALVVSLGAAHAQDDGGEAGVPGGEIENAEDAWRAQVDQAILDGVGAEDVDDLIGVEVASSDGVVIGTIDRFELIGQRPYAIIALTDGGDSALSLFDITFEDAGLTYGGATAEDIGTLPGLEELRAQEVVPDAEVETTN